MSENFPQVEYFKALADPTRFRICAVLRDRELSVNEIVSVFSMGQSRISRHLKILADCGFISYRRDGLWSFYTLVRNGEPGALMNAISYLFETDECVQDVERAEKALRARSEGTVRYFNNVASSWDRERREILGGFDINTKVMQLLGDKKLIADLGCGSGAFASELAANGHAVIGVDSSPKMISASRDKSAERGVDLDLRIGELEHLPLRDGEVDGATVILTLHHLSNPAQALGEIARVVKSGGSLVIVDFEKHSMEEMRSRYHDLWLGFSRKEMTRWVEESSFHVDSYTKVKLDIGLSLIILCVTKGAQ
ncbi:MAG TPA: metalloregulator ArsR/SmtB family transcription factor [Spirochaetota bacterium]